MAGEENLKKMASQLLDDTFKAIPAGADIQSAGYADVRKTVEGISGEPAAKDVTPSETAMFIFSMKEAYFSALQSNAGQGKSERCDGAMNRTLDGIALITFESYGRKREHLIKEQQKALLELSTPIVKVWDRILDRWVLVSTAQPGWWTTPPRLKGRGRDDGHHQEVNLSLQDVQLDLEKPDEAWSPATATSTLRLSSTF